MTNEISDDHTETEKAEFLWKARSETAEAELAAIKRGHGKLGRYEQLRLKNAELVAELAKEQSRLGYMLAQDFRTPTTQKLRSDSCWYYFRTRADIDQAMKEESK